MIRYSHIVKNSMVDGPGVRTVLFFQGCSIRCPGCQNPHLWPAQGGMVTQPSQLAALLAEISPHKNLTILGGEPFDQPAALFFLLRHVRELLPDAHIIVYTGYTWEQLQARYRGWFDGIMPMINILVDGPFIARQDDALITWRGSRNQRPINVPATLRRGKLILENWDSPEIIIDPNGDLHLPIGLAQEFSEVGEVKESRRCGQSA